MASQRPSQERIDAAIDALLEPGALQRAQATIAAAAPGLQRILAEALFEGGWFGESHDAQVRAAAQTEDPGERAGAIATLLAEETRLGMMVGAAVGYALAAELDDAARGGGERERHGEGSEMAEVEFSANGGTARGYLAEPEGEGPGVVVLQEWWGLDAHIRDICDRFAGEGFVALAPDLFHGETTDQPDEAEQKMMAMNMAETEKEMRGAVDYLAEHPKCDGTVGTIGFCLGGGLSVWAAAANPKVGAAVTYYYVMPHGKPDFSSIEAPVLGHFGTGDDFVSVDDAKQLEREIAAGGNEVGFEFYEGAGHAFFNDTNRLGTYDEQHAQSSWRRTLDFLRRHLGRG